MGGHGVQMERTCSTRWGREFLVGIIQVAVPFALGGAPSHSDQSGQSQLQDYSGIHPLPSRLRTPRNSDLRRDEERLTALCILFPVSDFCPKGGSQHAFRWCSRSRGLNEGLRQSPAGALSGRGLVTILLCDDPRKSTSTKASLGEKTVSPCIDSRPSCCSSASLGA